jgi:uncharacterized protein YfaS (alpha-2-macroglobulin family)
MRDRLRRFALIIAPMILLAPLGASAVAPPTVLSATPGVNGRAIARFTLRFSEPMTALGKQAPAPIAMKCGTPGSGRWTDPSTYVWEYDKVLPPSTTCRATLVAGLKTHAGRAVAGTRAFTIDSGGPYAAIVLPREGSDDIEEDEAFLIAPNGPVDRASVAAGAYCAVDGIGERIAVDLLPQPVVDKVVASLSGSERSDLLIAVGADLDRRALSSLGLGGRDDARDAAERKAALANVLALKCRRPLPPGHDMALVWGASIRSPSGRTAGSDQRFDYSVRKEFSARLTCGRTNPQAGCDPVEPMKVEFSAPVPRAKALAVRLEAGGRSIAPVDEGHEPALSTLKFKPPLPPSTMAKLVMPAGLTDESGRTLANARRFPLDVAIDQPPPLVKFAAPFGILEAKQGGVLPVTVRGVEPELGEAVHAIGGGAARVDGDDAAIAGWLRKVEKAQRTDIREVGRGKAKVQVNHTGDRSVFAGAAPAPVQRMQMALPGKGRQFEVVGMPLSKPGFYVVELASPTLGRALLGRPATRYVAAAALVTDMSVHFKWGRAASLVWVTSLDSGQPVAGAAVRVTDSCTGALLASGLSDGQGRMLVKGGLPAPSSRSDCEGDSDESRPLMVSARLGGDYSFVLSTWNQGIGPYDFDLPWGYREAQPIFHTILDRTLIRAGETIHMKHVWRAPTPAGFRTGGALKGTLVLQHVGSDTAYQLPLTLGGDGIGENEWQAPKDAPGGDYSIKVKVGDDLRDTGGSFRVDEYRLPSMRATIQGPKTRAPRPRRLPLDLYVGYLAGGGAGGAPIKLRTEYETLSDRPDGWEGWTFGGDPIREGTSQLDEEENAPGGSHLPSSATLPLTLGKEGALRTELDIAELQESLRMRVEMDYEDANGETLTAATSIPLYASAVRLGIKPDGWMQRAGEMRLKVAALDLDGNILRGQPVEVQLFTREILSARRRLIGGFYAFDNNVRVTKLGARCAGVTDDHGLVECTLEPGVSGEVMAMAVTRDRDGNEARAVTSVYLAGDDDWWFGGDNGDRMDIIPDAKSYHTGDTAKVQVRMPFREATALVTVEREGVLSSFVTTLNGKDPVIEVPMAGSYAPDAYISVLAVRGRVAGWRLWLAEFAKNWHLPFFNDPSQPTALVDLAKPAYRLGITKVKVGWEAHELKVKVKPEREKYHVRDTARVAVQVTSPGGKAPREAEIAFTAVDEALLILSPNESWNVLDAMMEERPLSVMTSTAQMQVVGKRHYGRKALAAGGGGGGDLSAMARSDFRPLLVWKGRVPLDADGRAVVDVPLADSLSSYRLVAVATAGEDLFGTGSANIRTVQDLGVYSGVPPLVRSGDMFDAVFTLRNSTDKDLKVTASADVSPLAGDLKPQTVTVPAGGAVPVTWRVTAPETEALRWTVTAKVNGAAGGDRIVVDEQVVSPVPEETWAATFVRLSPGLRLPVAPPAGALPGRGGIEVALTASPAPSLTGVRDYMLAYPYGCFEQRLSKAIALDDRAVWAKQMADLPHYIASNGLLRYWPGENQDGSIALTAYALSITAEAGLPWPAESKAKMIEALRTVVDGRLKDATEAPFDARILRIASAAALARNGASSAAMADRVAMPLRDMPTSALADWIAILDRTPGIAPRAKQAAEQALRQRIVYEGTRLDVTDNGTAPWWMMISTDEMAIKALYVATGRPGWKDDAPKMMVGVATRQRRGHWDTTPANAWGTLAVRRFAATYPGIPTGVTTVQLGGQTLSRPWPSPQPAHFPLPAAETPLLFSHSGPAQPWAFVSVKAAVPLTAPSFAGYRVAREVSFLVRKAPNVVSRGDVMKVRITVDAAAARSWVVIDDPIPAGASIIGGGGQSSLLAEKANGEEGWWPSYIERSHGAWRAYYGWMPRGRVSIEYAVRINSAGRFQLPPTHVEAMYSPEIRASLPNRPLEVAP